MMQINEISNEERDRLLDLEARMRGVSKQTILSISQQEADKLIDIHDFDKQKLKRKIEQDDLFQQVEIQKKIIKPNESSNIVNNKKITEFMKKIHHISIDEPLFDMRKSPSKQFLTSIRQGNKLEEESRQKLREEVKALYKTIQEKDSIIKEQQLQINELGKDNVSQKEKNKKLSREIEEIEQRIENSASYFKEVVLELEKYKRNELKQQILQNKQRLGEFIFQRDGTKIQENWIDGEEIKQMKNKLKEIQNEKEELEKKKPSKLKKYEIFQQHPNEEQDCYKMRIQFRLNQLNKEETQVQETLEKLELEKTLFIKQLKRIHEEEHSRFLKSSNMLTLGNRYQLVSLLGKGGFSEVYRGWDLKELRQVGCKIHQLNPNWSEQSKSNYIKHAIRENQVHRELNHPNIVKLYDSVEIDSNSFCTVLEYCDGPDLGMQLKKCKTINEKESKHIIAQILSALKYWNSYKNKLIHYDLKPQNILFHQGMVKISDFGLCKIIENEETKLELTSQGVGTYWYLPPECFQVSETPPIITPKVDIWSIGVIFFEILFGTKPFGNQMTQEKILKEQIILKSTTVQFPNKPIVSNEAKDFIRGCLMYKPSDRLDVIEAYNHAYFKKY